MDMTEEEQRVRQAAEEAYRKDIFCQAAFIKGAAWSAAQPRSSEQGGELPEGMPFSWNVIADWCGGLDNIKDGMTYNVTGAHLYSLLRSYRALWENSFEQSPGSGSAAQAQGVDVEATAKTLWQSVLQKALSGGKWVSGDIPTWEGLSQQARDIWISHTRYCAEAWGLIPTPPEQRTTMIDDEVAK